MTFNVGHVDGGTGAGRKRPLRDKPGLWACLCTPPLSLARTMHPGYLARCTNCGVRRPKGA